MTGRASAWVYIHDLRATGVVRNAFAIAERLARDRPTTLVAGYAHGFLKDEAGRLADVRLLALRAGAPAERAARMRVAPALAAAIARERPALVLSAGKFGHPTLLAAGMGRRTPLRVYRMSNEISRGRSLRTFTRTLTARAVARDAALVTFVGPSVAASPAFSRVLADGRGEVVHNGVDLEAARERARAPAPHLWLEESTPVVLGIGRLHPQKNWPLLLDAMAEVRRARRVRLVILGRGSARIADALQRQAAGLGLADDFLLAGESDNVFAWAARAAVFALPSRWEGSSMALLEALAVGTPVVASVQAGDAAHVLADGRWGLLADADDVPGFAAALERQLEPDPVRPGDRAAAFGMAAMLDRYALLVARLLGEEPDDDREEAEAER